MTSVEDMTLGLPDPIEAEPAEIRSGAGELDDLHNDMLGQSGDTDSHMRSSADQFTDRVAWDITAASADELMAWEEASKALTYGAGVLRLWAEDIDTYLTERASIVSRWQTAKSEMLELRVQGGSGYAIGMAVNEFFGGDGETGALEQTRQDLRAEHAGVWGTLMGQAEQTKVDLRTGPSKETLERMVEAGLLTAGQIATYGDHYPAMVPDQIDGSEPPHLVNAWWDSLSEEEREQVMADDPDLLRDLDGIPATVRDQLNQDYLEEEIERLEAEVGKAEEERDEAVDTMGDSGGEIGAYSSQADLTELRQELDTLTTLHESLNEKGSDRYLLALDPNDRGRAIVSNGNPDTADNVATLVPGTTTTWQSINDQMGRADDLARAANRADDEADHAVISWIGYDAPSIPEAAGRERAEGAVDDLSRFQDGLRATHGNSSQSNNTVIGHSYGSTVVGHTAQGEAGLNADEIVLVGSPGTNSQHASELGFLPENVHASTAENDGITGLTDLTHGADPTSPDFGATVFESAPGSSDGAWPLRDAHSQYFLAESKSLRYMGEVIAGNH